MSLFTLPAELKLDIAEYLDPESSLDFALTCKDHAAHCKPVLRAHREKFSERQVIDAGSEEILLWKVLKDVLHDPRLGWYIKELNLPPPGEYEWTDGDDDCTPSQEDKELFNHAARQLQYLYPVEERYADMKNEYPLAANNFPSGDLIGCIQNRINAGFADGVIAILLHYLPFLDTIRLTQFSFRCLELSLLHVGIRYKTSTPSSRLPLRRLKTASVAYHDTEMCCHADWACFFTGIPSLKTFAARNMGDKPRLHAVYQERLFENYIPTSNVTELFFAECQFDVKGLSAILAGIKNLKKFTYTGGGATVSEAASYEPKRVIQALIKYAAHSLEELVLYQYEGGVDLSDEQDLSSANLRNLQKLRVLECGWDILRPLENDDGDDMASLEEGFYTATDKPDESLFDVRTILPKSLEALYIRGGLFDGIWYNLVDAFTVPSASTPNLRPDRTCIHGFMDDTGARIGEADVPAQIWDHELYRLFDGHGPY